MKPTLLENKGIALERQNFTWRDLVQKPISKLDDDAFTRVRIILMNGIELEALRFDAWLRAHEQRRCSCRSPRCGASSSTRRRMINWLIGADHSPLETTIGYEQVAIEVTAAVAQHEPDPYLAQVYRFGLLEDFDHLYRYSALLDRLEGKDANNILQSYTDILPGRPTVVEHRAPEDDLRRPYDRRQAAPLTKLHALTIMAAEHQTHDYYMNIGPLFADPLARQLYAEIASIEEQHVTQYESMHRPERELAREVAAARGRRRSTTTTAACSRRRTRGSRRSGSASSTTSSATCTWRCELFKQHERRDPAEILPADAARADPVRLSSASSCARRSPARPTCATNGTEIVPETGERKASKAYREVINADGSPSETVAAGYCWAPGSELKLKAA